MGVAGLMFEPHPPNFENHTIFEDVKKVLKCFFFISLTVLDLQRSVWSVPSIYVAVLALVEQDKIEHVS